MLGMTMFRSLLLLLSLACCPLAQAQSPSGWSPVEVPSSQDYSGHGWYRTWLMPHAQFFTKHERDLFRESVIINIRGLTGAHEVFVNGTSIGKGGAFPPEFGDGREGNHRHKVTPGLLEEGKWNEIAVHVYNPEGPSGFLTEAPFIMNYFQECVLEGTWEFQPAEKVELAGKPMETEPVGSSFADFHESNRPLGRAEHLVHGEKLPPEESFAMMSTPEDLEVALVLHEPTVAQPVHFSFDAKGRLWVAQYRQYPYPAGLTMLSRDRYYRSKYDKVPPAPPNHDRGADIISIHEDTDGDGSYDKNTVFQDGLNMANSVLRGHGGVWVMHTPYLLFYPDADFDDVPDGPPVVHLQGFGLEDTHSVANGLVWGMDGWLYGAQGSTTVCHVTRPGLDPPGAEGTYFQGCMVWRYHPETREFELFAEGGGNNFGLELDSQGRLFTGHNGGGTRGWHYVQGGQYLMQGVTPNKFGPPHNPFAFGDLPKMRNDQPVARFTHFAALVDASAIPAPYKNHFFAIDPLHNFVIASRREPLGATFETFDAVKVLTSEDHAFRPVYIGGAPDGSVLVADMYEHYIAHGQHYQSQIDPTSGRIYRLKGKDLKLEPPIDLSAASDADLVRLLGHPNRWHRHTAVRLIGERKPESMRLALQKRMRVEENDEALCALWAYFQAFGVDDELVDAGLRNRYAPVRWWTVRLMCDSGDAISGGRFERLLAFAEKESDAETRSQLAASARRLPPAQGLPLVSKVLEHDEDMEDLYIPLMAWWVLEARADDYRDEVMGLFADAGFWEKPLVVEYILPRMMRRLAMQGRNRDLLDAAQLLSQAPTDQHREQLLKGFEEAYQGRAMAGLPKALVEELAKSGTKSVVLQLRLGEEGAVDRALVALKDPKAEPAEKLEIIRTLGELKEPKAMEPLLTVLDQASESLEVKRAAIVALMGYEDSAVGSTVLRLLPVLPAELQPGGFDLLLSREPWTRDLVMKLQQDEAMRELVSAETIQRLQNHANADLRGVVTELFPEPRQLTPEDFQQQIAEVELILKAGSGNPYAGEAAFMERCAACHQLFFKGGAIGPNLTDYQRDTLDTMLVSIVNPNAEIREGFEYHSVKTKDGRMLSGFLVDQDTQVLVLRGLAGEDIRVPQDQVEEVQPLGRSLMPESLLAGLSDQQLRDFFAYLRISQPITK